jgi:hypothetical protein
MKIIITIIVKILEFISAILRKRNGYILIYFNIFTTLKIYI